MRVLHTSDWHLGKRLDSFSRLPEQEAVMDELCQIADTEQADVILIAGDIYDTFNPPVEAVELFYRTVKHLSANGTRPVIAIAGNHDSPDRIEAPDSLARQCGIFLAGYPTSRFPLLAEGGFSLLQTDEGFLELALPAYPYPLRVLFTPYANEQRLRTYLGADNEEDALRDLLQARWAEKAQRYCDSKGVNILLSHLFFMRKGGEAPPEPEDEKPILHIGGAQAIFTENLPPQIQYVALGHLHRKQVIDRAPCPVVYAGSPLSYSFGEANQRKYVLLIDVEPDKQVEVKEIPLHSGKPLVRGRFDSVEKAVLWLEENKEALVELTLVTDDYLTAAERKLLHQTHSEIITLIPEVKSKQQAAEPVLVNLSQSMDALFADYFRKAKGQNPNDDILQLFNEIQSTEVTE